MMPIIEDRSNLSIETVLFATDFSRASEPAGRYASAISMHFRTNLAVVHAFTLSQAAMEAESSHSIVSKQRRDLDTLLFRTAHTLLAGRGESESALLEGEPPQVIPALAALRAPALIVLGTHGRNVIDRHLLGSVAEGILHHSTGPVLTVGPHVPREQKDGTSFQHILYATDCSLGAAPAASYAIAFAESYTAHIDVLNVVRPEDIEHPDRFHSLQQHLYSALDPIVPQQARAFCDARTFVSVGEPHSEILKHLAERNIDLLVLALKRNSHLGMQNKTSGAFPIIAKAQCPVLTFAVG